MSVHDSDIERDVDESRLDDVAMLESVDADGMLRDVATSGAQVRAALSLADDAGFGALADGGRPRAFVVTGMGGSGIAGDVVAAVVGPGAPVPIVTHRGFGLPGWVGAADVVATVSCSGTTAETLSAAEEAVRRGARVVGVGADGSPLAELVGRARAPFVAVPSESQPRAMLWALATPVLVAASAVGLVDVPPESYAAAADILDGVAQACRPTSETFVNPAKQGAVEVESTLPLVWGTTPLAGVAAYRFACQLAENAKYPAVSGVLPEALHNQVVTFAGAFARGAHGDEDFFRDRVEDPTGAMRLRLVLFRDTVEATAVEARRLAVVDLAEEYAVPLTEVVAEGDTPLERLASLIGTGDFISVYVALLQGIDPTPVVPITDLKDRVRR